MPTTSEPSSFTTVSRVLSQGDYDQAIRLSVAAGEMVSVSVHASTEEMAKAIQGLALDLASHAAQILRRSVTVSE